MPADFAEAPGFPPYASLTPIMQQYVRLKAKAPDCLLFFRLGDFYELFGPDAETAGALLGIAVTSRDRDKQNAIPMAGVPHHSVQGYLAKLLDLGHRVAIAEQLQDPATTKGMVDRDIVRILSPGTVLEEDLLASPKGNYLAVLAAEPEEYGLALVELSTGTLLVATEPRPRDETDFALQREALGRILGQAQRFEARELLTPASLPLPDGLPVGFTHGTYLPHGLGAAWARERICKQLQVQSLASLDLGKSDAACCAIAEALRVVERLAPSALPALTRFTLLARDGALELDATSLRNLEVLANAGTGRAAGSLLGVLDKTKTPMGRRLMREVLALPLRDPLPINARQAAVAELVTSSLARESLRDCLGGIKDLARITGRAQAGLATPRDCLGLLESLERCPGIGSALRTIQAPLLQRYVQQMGEHAELATLLARAIDPEAPAQFQAGRVIARGYSSELDHLRSLAAGSKVTLQELEASERARTGLKLKVGHNRVHGYYFEIPKSQKARVPEDWHARQSLVNAERFVTQPLKDLEGQVLGAEERASQLESGLFKGLTERIASEATSLRRTAEAVAWLDLFASLAQTAAERRWVRPETLPHPAIHLTASRHPVLEDLLGPGQFVPNDANFEPQGSQVNILTGPNMAGKSTFMRQVALCCLLHQIGSFVPAAEARLGCFDRILTRVGATDDLARGQSTFMVEMVETAQILHHCTPQSLVLLDEIGRGTSTYDGLALAWAIAEYLHNTPSCRALTLFATHYHELTQLAEHYEGIKNWRVLLKEQDGQIVFLRRVTEGRAQKSYGVVVARLAGLPTPVVERAAAILQQLDHQKIDPQIDAIKAEGDRGAVSWPGKADTLPLFGG